MKKCSICGGIRLSEILGKNMSRGESNFQYIGKTLLENESCKVKIEGEET